MARRLTAGRTRGVGGVGGVQQGGGVQLHPPATASLAMAPAAKKATAPAIAAKSVFIGACMTGSPLRPNRRCRRGVSPLQLSRAETFADWSNSSCKPHAVPNDRERWLRCSIQIRNS